MRCSCKENCCSAVCLPASLTFLSLCDGSVDIHSPGTSTPFLVVSRTLPVASGLGNLLGPSSKALSTEALCAVLDTRDIVALKSTVSGTETRPVFAQVDKCLWQYSTSIILVTTKVPSASLLLWFLA